MKSERLVMSGPESGPVTGLTPAWPRTAEALAELQRMLQCSSCNKLLQEPVCLGGCEHVFCRVCVADSLGNGCPVCRAPAWVKDLQPNRQLHNIVNLCNQLEALLNKKGLAVLVIMDSNVLYISAGLATQLWVCLLPKKLTLRFLYLKKGTK